MYNYLPFSYLISLHAHDPIQDYRCVYPVHGPLITIPHWS